ncbi:MAG: nucleotidyltransferase [Crocinitomix sp.]|nr:nucleotidyltransferase [Crocinitomix sp.]
MGGSGGGFFYRDEDSTEDIIKKIKKEQEQARGREFENDVNQLINDVLKNANDRNTDVINRHLDTLIQAINKDIDGNVQTIFGGSVSKHTYVDGLSDIDVLVILNNSELTDKSPIEVNEYFAEKLEQRLPGTEIEMGKLAVTVKYSDNVEIQILPSIRTETGIKIAEANGENWSKVVKPARFAEKLVSINQDCNGKVIPVIKLVKSIISELPEKRQINGYHIESMAVSIFSNYNGPKTSKEMLKHFLGKAVTTVINPIKDSTGQSVNTDSYLGEKNSVLRKAVSDSLSSIVRKIDVAERSGNIEKWKEILG